MSEELEESELGTQEYWDKQYKTEVSNFRKHGDTGEVWFGEDISDRIMQWMEKHVIKTSHILDIGCGNGMLLVELSRTGYENLTGIDYSEDAIVLAKDIASHYDVNIRYKVGDILKNNDEEKNYDIILDKGTYDAISLTQDANNNRQIYINNVHSFLKDYGLLIITSCNWTKDELVEHFQSAFITADVIPTPQFKFGGKIGNVVSSVVFKRK